MWTRSKAVQRLDRFRHIGAGRRGGRHEHTERRRDTRFLQAQGRRQHALVILRFFEDWTSRKIKADIDVWKQETNH